MKEDRVTIRSRDTGKIGYANNRFYRCQLEGCNGRRLTVKWTDGKTTKPCTKGMNLNHDGSWTIL